MNDQSRSPIDPDDDGFDDAGPLPRRELERKLMERARAAAERDSARPPVRILQHALALVAALAVVLVFTLGFDAFLTNMQRVMHMLDEAEQKQLAEQKELEDERKRREEERLQAIPPELRPMPAYVVPADD
jgi:hypothetical protein